jgi:SAM-dependent methyltransferase
MEPPRSGPTSEVLAALKRHSFYHFIDLGDGRETQGWATVRPVQQLVLRQLDRLSFEGKRVLDVGCRDGLFSFYAEKRNAAEVVAIDNSLSSGAVEVLIPYFRSSVRMHEMNLFDLTPDRFGRFDIINFPGVLYHLRYPFLGLKILRDLLAPNGILVLETAILRIHEGTALLYCPAPNESPYEKTSVTFFNPRGLRDSLASFGYQVEGCDYLYGINAFRLPYTNVHLRLAAMANQLQRWIPGLVRLLLRRHVIDRGVFVCRIDPTLIDQELEDYWNRTYQKVTYD